MNKPGLLCTASFAALVSVLISTCVRPLDASPSVPLGDASRGKVVFERRCSGCHALDRNDEGPKLRGVYGRTSGTVARFPYSAALKQAHIVWDDKSLDQWLAHPDTLVPGSEMPVYVGNQEERQNLIAYLKASAETLTSSGKVSD